MLLDQIDKEISTCARDALVEQAWRTVLGNIVVITSLSFGHRMGDARPSRRADQSHQRRQVA